MQSCPKDDSDKIFQLGLSSEVEALILEKYPEIIPDILENFGKQNFSEQEEITVSAYLIEGVTFLRSEKGKPIYYLPCDPDTPPGDYSEYYLNEQLVFMEVLGEVVVDRLTPALKNKFSNLLQ